jgi:hypothetical protein
MAINGKTGIGIFLNENLSIQQTKTAPSQDDAARYSAQQARRRRRAPFPYALCRGHALIIAPFAPAGLGE